jgi:hypothetical protein
MTRSEANCNGTWYCWDDSKWHCAPPDASAPGQGGYDAGEIEASLMGEGYGAEAGTEAASRAGVDGGSD